MRQPLTVRERTEDFERASLSTWATLAPESKGRDRFEELDLLRTAFQLDRDRLLQTAAFERLQGKSHAFVPSPNSPDRRRSRLTHTLVAASVARTLARGLRLNEDLVEAICLGHALGAPAFGRAGAEALAAFTDPPFDIPEQSLRLVETLLGGGAGLNLTWEVREGILHHPWTAPPSVTPEGQTVRLALRIAELTADLDAALHAGITTADAVPAEVVATVGLERAAQVSAFQRDVIATSTDQPEVAFSSRAARAADVLEAHLRQRVHERPDVSQEAERAVHCLRSLVVYHLENPPTALGAQPGEHLAERVLDHVSWLQDGEALEAFRTVFLPGGPRRD